ncbi:hypothetical protein ACFDR9_004500 [Janthinobacterium sp. CG_23.3]
MIHKKESAGGCDTTADNNYLPPIISFCNRIKAALLRFAVAIAAVFGGRI